MKVVPIASAKEVLKPGDIVQLLTGGCHMVVGSLVKDEKGVENYVDCYWASPAIVTAGGSIPAGLDLLYYWNKVFPIAVLKRVKT